MFEMIERAFDPTGFPKRWECGEWSGELGWTHIAADLAIFGAYTAIPVVLAYFVTRRRDIPFHRIFWLFVLFIFSCGTTHLLEAVIFWNPIYRFAGLIKVVTAIASWGTVLALIPVIPKALALPGLQRVNLALEAEIAERRRTESVLRDSEARFRGVVDTAVDGICIINSAGLVEFVNPAVEKMFGYTSAELIGHNVKMIMPSPDRDEHDRYMGRYHETGQPRIIGVGREVVGQRKDGSTFDIHLSVGEFQQDGKRFYAGIMQDITRRKSAEASLLRVNEQLAHKNREMEEFLSIIAHDLKHPAVSIQWLLSVLRNDWGDRLDAENQQNLNLMLSECERMKEMLTQLSQLARLERVEVKFDTVNLAAFIAQCVDPFRPRFNAAGADLQVSAADVQVNLPRAVLQQAMANLLDNAIKYGCQAGACRVEVTATVSHGKCNITVRDNGPGIEPRYHDRVFQPFRRLARDEKAEGQGVGLTAVRRLMQRFGGTVTLDSDADRGAAFTLSFPAA